MRLFVAVDLDDAARAAIVGEQRHLRGACEGGSPMRWVTADHLHLTLVFLGEVDSERAAEVVDTLRQPVEQPPFALVFEGVGAFPPHGAPRALWIGVSGGGAELAALQRTMADRVAGTGVALDSRPFRPHLTLARWKTSRSGDRQRALGAARSGVVARTPVAHATLYHSRVTNTGPTYIELARARLTGR